MVFVHVQKLIAWLQTGVMFLIKLYVYNSCNIIIIPAFICPSAGHRPFRIKNSNCTCTIKFLGRFVAAFFGDPLLHAISDMNLEKFKGANSEFDPRFCVEIKQKINSKKSNTQIPNDNNSHINVLIKLSVILVY